MEDPLERLERNERQGFRALRYVLLSAAALVVVAVAIVAVLDVTGPECPDFGSLCVTAGRVEVVVIPTLLGLLLAVGAGCKTYSRWKNHIRWRPWLFATYALWIVTTGYLLASASAVFVELG